MSFKINTAVVFTFREKYSESVSGNNPISNVYKNSNLQSIVTAIAQQQEDNGKPIDGQWMFGNVISENIGGFVKVKTRTDEYDVAEKDLVSLLEWEAGEEDRKDKLDFLDHLGEDTK